MALAGGPPRPCSAGSGSSGATLLAPSNRVAGWRISAAEHHCGVGHTGGLPHHLEERGEVLLEITVVHLRAMAELGPGPHRSGDIAAALGRKVTHLATVRANLIAKGMLWSPGHGDTAFTVPLFDEFLRRILPGEAWRD